MLTFPSPTPLPLLHERCLAFTTFKVPYPHPSFPSNFSNISQVFIEAISLHRSFQHLNYRLLSPPDGSSPPQGLRKVETSGSTSILNETKNLGQQQDSKTHQHLHIAIFSGYEHKSKKQAFVLGLKGGGRAEGAKRGGMRRTPTHTAKLYWCLGAAYR